MCEHDNATIVEMLSSTNASLMNLLIFIDFYWETKGFLLRIAFPFWKCKTLNLPFKILVS